MGVGPCSRTQRVFINHTRLGELFAPASRHADRKFSFPVKENKQKRPVLAEQNEKCNSIIQSWCARCLSWEPPKFFMHAPSFNNSGSPGATTLSTHYFHFQVPRAIYWRCRSACFCQFTSTSPPKKKWIYRFVFCLLMMHCEVPSAQVVNCCLLMSAMERFMIMRSRTTKAYQSTKFTLPSLRLWKGEWRWLRTFSHPPPPQHFISFDQLQR